MEKEIKFNNEQPVDNSLQVKEKVEKEPDEIDDLIEKETKEALKENPRSTVLFVIPPFPARTYPGRTMGPDYIGSHLRETGKIVNHNISDWEVLDLDVVEPTERERLLREKLKEKPYAFVGISYLSFQADEAMELASLCSQELKQLGDRQKQGEGVANYTPIVCGGRGVTDAEDFAKLYPDVDFFVTGKNFYQPLDSIVHIAELVKQQKVLDLEARKTIPGIVSFDPESEQVIKTQPNIEPEHAIDYYFENIERKSHHQDYDFDIFQNVVENRPRKTAQVYTQLGCSRYCSFCFESLRPQPKQERSTKSFIKEAVSLIRQGYEGIYFDDSTFTQDKKRAMRIMQIMGKLHRKFGTVWGFNTRIDTLDEELIDVAVKNGCVYNFEGVESLVPEVIEGMGKIGGKQNLNYPPVENGSDYVRRTKEVFQIMKEKGLTNAVFLIFGAPKKLEDGTIGAATAEDDKKSIKESIWELKPKWLSFNIMRFIPDAAISRIPKYQQYRGGQEFRGGFYYKKWRAENQVSAETTEHPIYQAFESAGDRYPIPPHMDPEACYDLLKFMVDEVNQYYQKTGEQIFIRTDENFAKKYLVRDENGFYQLTEFENIK